MSKKNVLGLILFGFLVAAGLFVTADYMINQGSKGNDQQNQLNITQEDNLSDPYAQKVSDPQSVGGSSLAENPRDTGEDNSSDTFEEKANSMEVADHREKEENGYANISDNRISDSYVEENQDQEETTTLADQEAGKGGAVNPKEDSDEEGSTTSIASISQEKPEGTTDTLASSALSAPDLQLIYDSTQVDYEAYIPEMIYDSKIETMLDIDNPELDIKAEAAILFDAKTGEVLFYKNPIEAVFPASTTKLLTCLVTLEWCQENEEVTIGDEITMIASDSSKANIRQGQRLTIRNLLEGMLLPSGNDAAYAAAAYVGRKSLKNPNADKEEAVLEFMRLMNQKAKEIGVKNSCFKTPDGYDALGQYTTAFDMGLIGLAASENETIMEICQKSRSRNLFVSGEDVTWVNTNSLINKNSPRYYSKATGLKTGTSTMAGKCLIATASDGDKEVLCVVMNSTSSGRFDDATKLLKYGLH